MKRCAGRIPFAMDKQACCPVCASHRMMNFLKVSDVPVHVGTLWASQDAARSCPKGDIHLAFCQDCGFITNLAYDPGRVEYDQPYDNSLHFSAVFQDYALSLAQALVDRYSLFEKDVIEI